MHVILQLIGILNIVTGGMALFFVTLIFLSLFYLKDKFTRKVAISFLIIFSCSIITNYIMGQAAISSISQYDMSYFEGILLLVSRSIVVIVGSYILYICYKAFRDKNIEYDSYH